MFILDKMLRSDRRRRARASRSTRRSIVTVKINTEKIGAVIGPGGKKIRGIQEETGTKIDIEDDGTVYISGVGEEATGAAVERVEGLTYTPQIGDKITGKVKSIMPFGAFVEIVPGKDGFVHISQLGTERYERVEDAVAGGRRSRDRS